MSGFARYVCTCPVPDGYRCPVHGPHEERGVADASRERECSANPPAPLPETYRCAGADCPGLPWKASERPHPATCSTPWASDVRVESERSSDVKPTETRLLSPEDFAVAWVSDHDVDKSYRHVIAPAVRDRDAAIIDWCERVAGKAEREAATVPGSYREHRCEGQASALRALVSLLGGGAHAVGGES